MSAPPTFVHIGGQRCGSTWMYKCLQAHPEVYTSIPKEIHYFNGNRGKSDSWYLDHFKPSKTHKAWGEATPLYLSHVSKNESLPQELYRISPNCKIICCLRNPTYRAFSQWELWQSKKDSFKIAVENNYKNMLGKGVYINHIKRWKKVFPSDQILIQIHDEVLQNNKEAVRDAYDHIGVDKGFEPKWIDKNYNSPIAPESQKILKRVFGGRLVEKVKSSTFGDGVRRLMHKMKKIGGNSKVPVDVKKQLIEYYEPYNKELSQHIDKDLSHWNKT